LRLSEVQEADVVDLAHDGRGVARDAGKAIFIDGALPGERVRFRVIKRRRQIRMIKDIKDLNPELRIRTIRNFLAVSVLQD